MTSSSGPAAGVIARVLALRRTWPVPRLGCEICLTARSRVRVVEPPIFVDEFQLPSRHEAELSGWPDHGVEWPGRLFLIELKTERGSHRRDQLTRYLELASHHHPDRLVELMYLTPTMDVDAPRLPPSTGYAHTTWVDVEPLIRAVWDSSPVSWERTVADRLRWWIEQVEQAAPLPDRGRPPADKAATVVEDAPTPSVAVDDAQQKQTEDVLRLARLVQLDGEQRGIESAIDDPEELDELRLELRDLLLGGPALEEQRITHVLPWLWRAETSGGRPLTRSGAATGYELRLSRYETSQARKC